MLTDNQRGSVDELSKEHVHKKDTSDISEEFQAISLDCFCRGQTLLHIACLFPSLDLSNFVLQGADQHVHLPSAFHLPAGPDQRLVRHARRVSALEPAQAAAQLRQLLGLQQLRVGAEHQQPFPGVLRHQLQQRQPHRVMRFQYNAMKWRILGSAIILRSSISYRYFEQWFHGCTSANSSVKFQCTWNSSEGLFATATNYQLNSLRNEPERDNLTKDAWPSVSQITTKSNFPFVGAVLHGRGTHADVDSWDNCQNKFVFPL